MIPIIKDDCWDKFGEWLESPNILPMVKVGKCFDLLDASRRGEYVNIESLGKASSHLIYRSLDGLFDEPARVIELASWGKKVIHGAVSEEYGCRMRWVGSITIALAYLQLLRFRDLDAAAVELGGISDLPGVEIFPHNTLNQQRGLLLLAVYKTIKGLPDCFEPLRLIIQSFQLGVSSMGQRHFGGDELINAARMVKMSYFMYPYCGKLIGPKHPFKVFASEESSEPFKTAFAIMCGLPVVTLWEKRERLKNTRDFIASKCSGHGVELGVASGHFSASILTNGQCKRLWSIDRWNDHHGVEEYQGAAARLTTLGRGVCVPLRMTFEEALPLFKDDSLDFIYIDGYAHTGQENGKTLEDWWPKLRTGGIFAGHDYHHAWPLTVAAIDNFAVAHDFKFDLTGETGPGQYPSWWGIKLAAG